MSFSEKIKNSIDELIENYIITISNEFNIPENRLKEIFNNTSNIKTVQNLVIKDVDKDISKDISKDKDVNLSKLTKNELIEMCKTKNIKTNSKNTKSELIDMLKNTQSKVSINTDSITKKLIATIPTISIKRNKFNNYEHEETSFVFNNKEKKVYGKQKSDGTIEPLTKKDIDLCNKYKFSYYIPDNLNENKNIDNNDFEEELEEEVDDEEDVEEVEELEDEEEEFEEEFE